MVVVIPRQVGSFHDFLLVAIKVADLGCFASSALDLIKPAPPRAQLRRLGPFHSEDPAFHHSCRGERLRLRWLQGVLKVTLQIRLLQPAGNRIGIVLVRGAPLDRVGSAPEPRVDLRNYRGAGGWRQAVEGPEVKLGSGGTDVTKPGDPGMIGLGYRSLRRSERPISRTRPLLRPS